MCPNTSIFAGLGEKMPAIIYTSRNIASKNIAETLFSFCPKGVEMVNTRAESVLEKPEIDSDYLVILSSHKSKNPLKLITAHHPGNWGDADMGGEARKLNIAYGSRIKDFIIKAEELRREKGMTDWSVVIEADHHGPTIKKPIIFVEIGSTENEWKDKKAAEIVAEATAYMVRKKEIYESFFAIGGGHYAKEFTSFIQTTPHAVGHILPKYMINEVSEELLLEGVEKNVEKVKGVVLLKEQTNLRQKEKIKSFCQKNSLTYNEI